MMLFTVRKAEQTDRAVLVTGETHCGIIKGIWKSRRMIPLPGQSYQIELTFGLTNGTVACSAVTVERRSCEAKIMPDGDCVRFTGHCEAAEDIYFIRFSYDGLAMLDIQDDDRTIRAGDDLTFSLPFHETGIYPY